MVTAVAGVLARRGALFTLPPTGRAGEPAPATAGGGRGGCDVDVDGEGEGEDDRPGSPVAPVSALADDRQAALLFAAGRR